MKLKIYSFVRNIAHDRFDYSYIRHLVNHLKLKYEVEWFDFDGDDNFTYNNDCNVVINQGSIAIFELEDKTFKTYDFGDVPDLTIQLSKSKNFRGAGIGQYNKSLWDITIQDPKLRSMVVPINYMDSYWEFGKTNFEDVVNFRNSITLDTRLLWIGTIYNNTGMSRYDGCRNSIPLIKQNLSDKFEFYDCRIPFEEYISKCCRHKLTLGFGGGGGYTCGDYCLRDIDMYGIGIPTIRPKYNVISADPLIPNFHYISVDIDDCLLPTFRIDKTHELEVSTRISNRYHEVIGDDILLKYIAKNAKDWYDRNMTYPNIINNTINSIGL